MQKAICASQFAECEGDYGYWRVVLRIITLDYLALGYVLMEVDCVGISHYVVAPLGNLEMIGRSPCHMGLENGRDLPYKLTLSR